MSESAKRRIGESANDESDTQYAVRNTHYAPRITATTRLVGLLGWPVSHSLSPAMHNAAYAALGLNWVYVPLPTPPERLGDAVRGLAALGFAGANVTVPHKQTVMPFLEKLTPGARAVGAVNTIVVQDDGSLLGDNTDGAGFMADLQAHGVQIGGTADGRTADGRTANGRPADGGAVDGRPVDGRPADGGTADGGTVDGGAAEDEKDIEKRRVTASPRLPASPSPCHRVLILGAGGAARSVVYALLGAGATVAVVNRTSDHADKLCQTMRMALPGAAGRLSAQAFPQALPVLAPWADLIVNATTLGLHAGDPLPWDVDTPFRPGQVVYDLIYHRPTELLALARSQGAITIDGLGMLLHQGAQAAALWTGHDAGRFACLMRKELEAQ